jgi:hypothetical protein
MGIPCEDERVERRVGVVEAGKVPEVAGERPGVRDRQRDEQR